MQCLSEIRDSSQHSGQYETLLGWVDERRASGDESSPRTLLVSAAWWRSKRGGSERIWVRSMRVSNAGEKKNES